MKRTLDLVVAGAGLILAFPLLVLLAFAVRVTSSGPALFRQERIGLHGKAFTILKFRTMTLGGDDSAQREFNRRELAGELEGLTDFTLPEDDRVTRVGRFLRKSSLDELPQLINVVRGEMSLVGPRPSLDWEVEMFDEKYQRRVDVRPGVTGLWQVSGRRAIDMRGMLELDLEYVDTQSMSLDLGILVKTVGVVLSSEGAG